MQGLVMPDLHSKPRADAATDDCEHQQGCFRYALVTVLGFPLDLWSSLLALGKAQTSLTLPSLTRSLVNAIDKEGHGIDNYQII